MRVQFNKFGLKPLYTQREKERERERAKERARERTDTSNDSCLILVPRMRNFRRRRRSKKPEKVFGPTEGKSLRSRSEDFAQFFPRTQTVEVARSPSDVGGGQTSGEEKRTMESRRRDAGDIYVDIYIYIYIYIRTEMDSRPAWDMTGSRRCQPARKSLTWGRVTSTMRKPVMLMAPNSITSLSHRSSIIWLQRNTRDIDIWRKRVECSLWDAQGYILARLCDKRLLSYSFPSSML